MKLRVRSNSVRLRLTKTEVSRVEELGECAAMVCFPGGAYLAYSLQASECDAVRAEFERCTVTVYVPRNEILEWSTTQAVGIYATVEAQGVELRVLIEKDFRCLDNSDEDQSDMFSNSNPESVSC